MSRIKLIRVVNLSFLFLLFNLNIASALDTPTLEWAKGRQQTITLGGETGTVLWEVTLEKDGKTFGKFNRSAKNSNGFYVYSIDLDENFPIGTFQVVASGTNYPPSTTAYVKVLNSVSYDPIRDPKRIGFISVVIFTLLSFFNMKGLENSSSEDDSSIGSVDKDYLGGQIEGYGPVDRVHIGRVKIINWFDSFRHNLTFDLSHRSPLATRVVSDSAYLQAATGPISFILLISSIALGIFTATSSDLHLSIIPSAVVPAILIMALGIFDSLAGLLGYITYFLYVLFSGHLINVTSLRAMLGLAIFWFTPILAAGNARPIRRNSKDWSLIERASDFLLAPIIGGWAAKGMLNALDGFAHQKTALAQHSNSIALLSGVLILIRLLVEDLVVRIAPARLEYLAPSLKGKISTTNFIFAQLTKFAIFIFFMFGFFGTSWQIIIATIFLILPGLLGRISNKFPNSSTLYQIIPTGIPGLVIMAFIGFLFTNWINSWPLEAADRSKTIFVLAGIPSFVLSLLKLFGRKPKQDDQKWYLRDKNRVLYIFGGLVMITLAVLITFGVIP